MTKAGVIAGGMLACLVCAAGPDRAAAQERREGVEVRREADRPADARLRRISEVIGSKVSIRGDIAVGKVEDVILTEGGCIDYLVVLNEDHYVTVPWEAARIDYERHTAAVDIERAKFQAVPTFTRDKWPNVYAPTYREKVYASYGLRPGQQRRIERREDRRR